MEGVGQSMRKGRGRTRRAVHNGSLLSVGHHACRWGGRRDKADALDAASLLVDRQTMKLELTSASGAHRSEGKCRASASEPRSVSRPTSQQQQAAERCIFQTWGTGTTGTPCLDPTTDPERRSAVLHRSLPVLNTASRKGAARRPRRARRTCITTASGMGRSPMRPDS